MRPRYVPRQGDIVWLTFEPQAGHEQKGRRPALVLSPAEYNAKVGLALFCPITSRIKGYTFEVLIPTGLAVGGAVLSDQVKSLDWRARRAKYADQLPRAQMAEVLEKLGTLLSGSEI